MHWHEPGPGATARSELSLVKQIQRMFRSASKEALAHLDFKLADRKATLHSEVLDRKAEWKLFAGNSNPTLAESVADHLGVKLAPLKCTRFNDGECSIQIIPSVRNVHSYVIQSTSPCRDGSRTINDHIMELFLLVRCLRRASSNTVTAIIPYYGYARQVRCYILKVSHLWVF
jgi:hypothetical protein